jgi:arylsulfatase A-like enzyme
MSHAEYFSVGRGSHGASLEQIKETKALTWGQVKSVDDSVGQVMEHLKKTGKAEKTIVLFLADHGELMGDHGLFCKGPFHYEGCCVSPSLCPYPKALQKGVRTEALASYLIFMPTVLELAGWSIPATP